MDQFASTNQQNHQLHSLFLDDILQRRYFLVFLMGDETIISKLVYDGVDVGDVVDGKILLMAELIAGVSEVWDMLFEG